MQKWSRPSVSGAAEVQPLAFLKTKMRSGKGASKSSSPTIWPRAARNCSKRTMVSRPLRAPASVITSSGPRVNFTQWSSAARSHGTMESKSRRRILSYYHALQARRIVQRKMILKRDLIPMQDDTENEGGLTGELRPNARTHADRRDIESRSDQPVFETGRHHRICRAEARRKVRVCAAITGRARVCTPRQEAARRHPRLPEQNDRIGRGADRAV